MSKAVTDLLNRLPTRRPQIAVVGDIVLDYYYPVTVNRISPEFPIPVLLTPDERRTVKPGGAANVVQQFQHFPADLCLFTLLGENVIDDLTPECRKAMFGRAVVGAGCHVPRKKRYYDEQHEFPLCRVDVEQPGYGLGDKLDGWRKQLIKQLTGTLNSQPKVDVVICSDYNKGVFDEWTARKVVSLCNERNIPVIVDPKKDHEKWQGCTIFKPNTDEAKKFVPDETKWDIIAGRLADDLECKAVVVTRGGKGVSGRDEEGDFLYRPKKEVVARSVIGAGDCFIAVFALAVAHGMPVHQAAEAAFEAGAVYVQKVHNEPVRPHELAGHAEHAEGKIVTADEMCYIMKTKPGRYVFTNGCFDLLHTGHLDTLRFARGLGDRLIVGLNGDDSVRRLKGPTRPLCPLGDRQRMVAALECVDFVVAFDEDTPKRLIEALRPEVLVKGGDYKPGDVVGADVVKEVHLAPLAAGRSTTGLVERIRGADATAAHPKP